MEVSVEQRAVRLETRLGDEEDGVPSWGLSHRRGRCQCRLSRVQLRLVGDGRYLISAKSGSDPLALCAT